MSVADRFLKYVTFPTMSDGGSESTPSTEKQFALARALESELHELGLCGVRLDENCYLYAELPATEGCGGVPAVGFIAHLDTSDAAPDQPVRARVVEYTGGDIPLDGGEVMRVSDYPYLEDMRASA